jgi:hypothetical protein
MILLLAGAFLLLLAKARQYPNPWLIAFLGSLLVSIVWGFLGPICYGMKAYDILNVGDISNRVTGLLGYVALFVYALALVRKK